MRRHPDPRLDHRLNALCPCGHAMWLHTIHCLVLKPVGEAKPGRIRRVKRCRCTKTAADFSAVA